MRKWGRFLNSHANLRTDPIFAFTHEYKKSTWKAYKKGEILYV